MEDQFIVDTQMHCAFDPERAVKQLGQLSDTDPGTRMKALEALAATVDWWMTTSDAREIVARLSGMLAVASPEERARIVRILHGCGPHLELALDPISRMLASADQDEVKQGLALARRLGDRAAPLRSILMELLEKDGKGAGLLAEIPPPPAQDVKQVLAILNAAPAEVQSQILDVFGAWDPGDPRVLSAVVVRLEHEEQGVRDAAFRALCQLSGGELAAAKEAVRRRADGDRFVFEEIDTEGPAVLDYLRSTALSGPEPLRAAAIQGLPLSELDLLKRFLEDQDATIRQAAAWQIFWYSPALGTSLSTTTETPAVSATSARSCGLTVLKSNFLAAVAMRVRAACTGMAGVVSPFLAR